MSVPDDEKPIQMPPQIWGPIFWSTLHIASLAYSDKPTDRQKANMKAFLESFIDVLPCPICRVHYEQNLEEMPLGDVLDSRIKLIEWVFTMHNRINVQLGKREIKFSEFVDSMRNLEKAKKACPPSSTNTNDLHKLKDTNKNHPQIIDILLLGPATVLLGGAAAYYLYAEMIKTKKL